VPTSLLTLIACSPILLGWLAVYACRTWVKDRGRRQQATSRAQWDRLAARHSDLDAQLDRAWAAERERIQRYS
jgi:hypothetical protein